MVDRQLLSGTAKLYSHRARDDDRFVHVEQLLNNVISQLDLGGVAATDIKNTQQFVVLRTRGVDGEATLVQHPLDLVESAIDAGSNALRASGLLEAKHTCLIAVSRGSLSGIFTCIYEIVRRCGWSILPLGGSDDREDISSLCNAYDVDTVFLAAHAVESVFSSRMIGRFDGVRTVLCVDGFISSGASDTIAINFPHVELRPFLFMTDITGPIGVPRPGVGLNTYEALDNVLLEVASADGTISLNGSGDVLASVLGLEEPTLIRCNTGDKGVLETSDRGMQVFEIRGRGPAEVAEP